MLTLRLICKQRGTDVAISQLFRAVIGDPDTVTVPVVSLPNSATKEDLKAES